MSLLSSYCLDIWPAPAPPKAGLELLYPMGPCGPALIWPDCNCSRELASWEAVPGLAREAKRFPARANWLPPPPPPPAGVGSRPAAPIPAAPMPRLKLPWGWAQGLTWTKNCCHHKNRFSKSDSITHIIAPVIVPTILVVASGIVGHFGSLRGPGSPAKTRIFGPENWTGFFCRQKSCFCFQLCEFFFHKDDQLQKEPQKNHFIFRVKILFCHLTHL